MTLKINRIPDSHRVWNPIDFQGQGQGHRGKFFPHNILVNTRIKILQWILTKLGTYLVLRRVWIPIDFQGHRPMSLKINRVPDSHKDYVCTKFGQNPLKDLDSSVHKDVMM
jgi:hypothetical protein